MTNITPPTLTTTETTPTPTPPAKRRPTRHTEWTRAKMVVFLRELAATQSVAYAAKAVGMSRTSAYNLRNRLQGSPFALGWEVALEMGMYQLAHAVMDRALNGVEVQRFYHGELVASTTLHDNRLAQWVLENPWRVGRHQIAREYSGQTFDALLERIKTPRSTGKKARLSRGRTGRTSISTSRWRKKASSCASRAGMPPTRVKRT